jgi:hypothetical protein
MTGLLAAVRPDEWNLALLVHVLGAMILVGGTMSCATMLGFARGDTRLLRFGYWSLLLVALPGYFLMRFGAEWIYSKEQLDDVPEDPAWIGIGFFVADAGALLLLIALVVGGIGVRRLGKGGGSGLLKATLVLSVLLLAAYVLAIWAMSAKPS